MSFDNRLDGHRYFNNLNRDPISRILNSDSMKEVRLKMLKGEKPAACMGCYKAEEHGLESKRIFESKKFPLSLAELRARTSASGEIQPNLEYAELRLGNLCNLKCRTCNPNSSSKWGAEYASLQDTLSFVTKYDLRADFTWAENEMFWSDFFQNSPNLKLLYINGGEPTLIKQHWEFLEKLVNAGSSTNIDIKYNINMTYLPENAFSIWKKFKSVSVGASIDDIAQRNSYIRHGAQWEKIISNLNLIKESGFHVAVEQTVSVYNIFYLGEMSRYCRDRNLGYGLNFVYDPNYLAINCLPDRVKSIVLSKLQNELSVSHLNEISSHFKSSEDLNLWSQFRTYNHYLDKSRNENFEEIFPEFSKVLKTEGFL